MRLDFENPGLLVFLIAALIIGGLLSVGALVNVLNYRSLWRRLRDERQRRKP